jgi:hypothetical protein
MTIRSGEKGIRCESGAVPAAVSSLNVFRYPLVTFSVLGMGRLRKIERARRPAIDNNFCFRVKGNSIKSMNTQPYFIFICCAYRGKKFVIGLNTIHEYLTLTQADL